MEGEKLIFMSNEKLRASFLNKKVRVILNEGKKEELVVDKLFLASYADDESYSAFGFVSRAGKSYMFLDIKEIYVIE